MLHTHQTHQNKVSRIKIIFPLARFLLLVCIGWCARAPLLAADLATAVTQIDARHPGELGVYVKQLGSGQEFGHQATRRWYLASLVKVPLAIAVLQAVEEKQFSLDDSLVLETADWVDGSGKLLSAKPGSRHTLGDLLAQSLEHSDSTATDMLMRRLGVDAFNRQIRQAIVPQGLGPFTTILQVRYDAYGELHPDAEKLSNLDFIEIKTAAGDDYARRAAEFRKKIKLETDKFRVPTLEEAFERYYKRDLNAGTLPALGMMLEKLVRGELLNSAHTDRILQHMCRITTGDERLKAGLPAGIPFAQKTGTQINRACNIGVTHPKSPKKSVVIVVCAEKFGKPADAEPIFQDVADALQKHGWVN